MANRQKPESAEQPELTGEALEDRARELDIKGRGTMSADELRDAVAAEEDRVASTPEPTAPAEPEPEQPPEGAIARDRLVAESEAYLGQPRYVVAGALAGSKDELTVDEARSAVEDFLQRPANQEA